MNPVLFGVLVYGTIAAIALMLSGCASMAAPPPLETAFKAVNGRAEYSYYTGWDMSDTKTAAKRRVLYGSRVYNIKAVRNLADDMKTEGRDYQQLLCVEGEPS